MSIVLLFTFLLCGERTCFKKQRIVFNRQATGKCVYRLHQSWPFLSITKRSFYISSFNIYIVFGWLHETNWTLSVSGRMLYQSSQLLPNSLDNNHIKTFLFSFIFMITRQITQMQILTVRLIRASWKYDCYILHRHLRQKHKFYGRCLNEMCNSLLKKMKLPKQYHKNFIFLFIASPINIVVSAFSIQWWRLFKYPDIYWIDHTGNKATLQLTASTFARRSFISFKQEC